MCVGSFIYYKYATNKAKTIASDFSEDEIKNNLEKHKNELIETQIPYLKKWMKDNPIDFFTDASIPISLNSKAKNAAVDAAKSVAWAVVGVKAKYTRVETTSFLVLSNDELHYLTSNVDGDLEEHIIFSSERLNTAKMVYTGAKKSVDLAGGVSDFITKKVSPGSQQNVFALTFNIDGTPLTINAHENIVLSYSMSAKNFTENSLIANMIAKEFFVKLEEKYPNLKKDTSRLVS